MTRPNALRALVALALVGGLVATTGCGSTGKPSSSPAAGTTTHSSPTATIPQALPADFPTDDVPLLDEKVISAVKGTPGTNIAWSVVLQTSRAVEDVTAEVKKDFTGAGYKQGQSDVMGDVSVSHFSSARYDVTVTAARTSGNVSVTYLVRTAG